MVYNGPSSMPERQRMVYNGPSSMPERQRMVYNGPSSMPHLVTLYDMQGEGWIYH